MAGRSGLRGTMDRKLRYPCENFAGGARWQRGQIAKGAADEVFGGGLG